MEVSVDDLSSVKKILHIEIPEEEVTAELNKAYQELKGTAKIKGFRKGKVPRNVLVKMFKKEVNKDVLTKLIQDSFYPAISKAKLEPLGQPTVEPSEFSEDGPYKYDISLEIKPELGDIDFKGLELKKTVGKVEEGDVDGQIKMLQRNMAEQKTVQEDRAIRDDDLVLLDYEVFKDGKPFEEVTKAENFKLKIGEALIAKEIDEALIGTKPGDNKDIDIKFPEDHFKDTLAGLAVTFKVKINQILEDILPKIDDKFLETLGQFKTIDDLKNAIENNLKQGYLARAEQELQEQVFDLILGKMDFDVPDVMIQEELQAILTQMLQSYQVQELKQEELEKLRDTLAAKYRDLAENQVKRHLILSGVAEQEKLELSEEEIDQGLTEMSARLKMQVEELKRKYEDNPQGMEFFKHTLLEKNAMRFIIESSTVENVEPEKVN